jgi:MFS family permease
MNSLVVSVMNFLLIAVGIAFVWILLAALVGNFADRKGHSGALWFGLSLICSPLIGFLVMALLPSADDLMPVGYRPCPQCGLAARVGKDICLYCNADLTGKGAAEKRAA